MRDRNDKFEQANEMLGAIHALAGGEMDESPHAAVARVIIARNKQISELSEANTSKDRGIKSAATALGVTAWKTDGSDLAEIIAMRDADRAAAYRKLRHEFDAYQASTTRTTSFGPDYKEIKAKLDTANVDAARMQRQITHLTTQLKNAEADRKLAQQRESTLESAIVAITLERIEERENADLNRRVMAEMMSSVARECEALKERCASLEAKVGSIDGDAKPESESAE